MKNLTRDQKAFVEAYCNCVADAPREEVVRFMNTSSEERGSREFYDSMSEYYGSIMDAHEVWHMAIAHALTDRGMTVGKLSAALANLPQHLPVIIWDSGDRLQIAHIDDSFVEDENPRLELNTDRDD
jgi:hypothetical protein